MRPLTTDPRFQPQFQPLASPSLPPADVVDFRGYFKVETFGHGAVIYRPGLPADKVYLLRSGRVRLLRQRVLGLTRKDVPARLAEMLIALAQAHGERIAPGNELCLHGITQQDLADLVGASRSFVSTLINKMKRDGLLANQGRLLVLRDEEGLNRVAAREK